MGLGGRLNMSGPLAVGGVVLLAGALIFASASDIQPLSEAALGVTGAILLLMVLTSYSKLSPFLFKTKGGSTA